MGESSAGQDVRTSETFACKFGRPKRVARLNVSQLTVRPHKPDLPPVKMFGHPKRLHLSTKGRRSGLWGRTVRPVEIWFFFKYLGWRNGQNENCRSRKVIKLCTWQLFDQKSSCQRKLHFNFSNLKFKFYKRPRMEKVPKKNYRYQKVMKLCSW